MAYAGGREFLNNKKSRKEASTASFRQKTMMQALDAPASQLLYSTVY